MTACLQQEITPQLLHIMGKFSKITLYIAVRKLFKKIGPGNILVGQFSCISRFYYNNYKWKLGHKTKLQFHLSNTFLANLILSHAKGLFCVFTYFCFACWIRIIIYQKLVYWQLPNPICWQKDVVHVWPQNGSLCSISPWCKVMCTNSTSAQTKQGSEHHPRDVHYSCICLN